MSEENKTGIVSRGFAGLTNVGSLISIGSSVIIAIGSVAIWGSEYIHKIDTAEKVATSSQSEISDLKIKIQSLEASLQNLSSKGGIAGPKGDAGPQGQQGPRGEKGDKGDTGESGSAVDGSEIAALIKQEISKLPTAANGVGSASGIALTKASSDCIVFKPQEDKVRLEMVKGMKFCLSDGELAETVTSIDEKHVAFKSPGRGGSSCWDGNKCDFDWLKSYEYYIENFDASGDIIKAIAIFKKKS